MTLHCTLGTLTQHDDEGWLHGGWLPHCHLLPLRFGTCYGDPCARCKASLSTSQFTLVQPDEFCVRNRTVTDTFLLLPSGLRVGMVTYPRLR